MKDVIKGYSNLAKKKVNLLNKDIAELSNVRMNICKKCPKLSKLQTCDICGCYMPSKTLVDTAECPDNKW